MKEKFKISNDDFNESKNAQKFSNCCQIKRLLNFYKTTLTWYSLQMVILSKVNKSSLRIYQNKYKRNKTINNNDLIQQQRW